MRVEGYLAGALIAVTISSSTHAATKAQTIQDQQQAACYDDVQRLCGSALPDVDKVTDCMKDKRPQVSAKCSAMWDVK